MIHSASFPQPIRRVFFYCLGNHFFHFYICLAEGLRELGIECYANRNYWQLQPDSSETLLKYNLLVTPDDCDVAIADNSLIHSQETTFNQTPILPDCFFHAHRRYLTVYIDYLDGPKVSWDFELQFDLVLRVHLNRYETYPRNVEPWCFGLSRRILESLNNPPDFKQRHQRLLVNFRNNHECIRIHNWRLSIPQGQVRVQNGTMFPQYSVRKLAAQELYPQLATWLALDTRLDNPYYAPADARQQLYWQQTEQRHNPNYYQHLQKSVACAAFGGCFVKEEPKTTEPQASGASQQTWVQWWDSWRFWESLAAGCLTIQVDFDKYGAIFPVQPENWQHYIGVDFDNLPATLERLRREPEQLAAIATAGRNWALEHYAPRPTAQRFLDLLARHACPAYRINLSPPPAPDSTLPFELGDLNVSIAPDWSQPDERLQATLVTALRAIAAHPDSRRMTLLVESSGIPLETANLALSSAAMELLLNENIDVANIGAIVPLADLDEYQWQELAGYVNVQLRLAGDRADGLLAGAVICDDLAAWQQWRAESLWLLAGDRNLQQGNWRAASRHYEYCLQERPPSISLYDKLSQCYGQLQQPHKMMAALKLGIASYPDSALLHFQLIFHSQHNNHIQIAIERADAALSACPGNYTFQILNNLLLPLTYERQDEILFYKFRFDSGLQALSDETPLTSPGESQNALAGISRFTPFYRAYQADNVRDLQRRYGDLIHRIVTANYPQWRQPRDLPSLAAGEKIRLGYASAYLHSYSGTLWLTGWLKYADRQQFEIYCYYTGSTPDAVTELIRSCCDVFHHIPEGLEATAAQIVADNLHILVFPELGMDAPTFAMAGLRLAPIQCSAWGHPVTSGLPTIDYFLSSELMEPENGQEHYTETLVRLPNIGVAYPKPAIPPLAKTRADYGLPETDILYLCCQAPFKYLPQYDYIFPAIAQQVPRAKFLWLRANLLEQRLIYAFAAANLNYQDYCLFLTVPERADYLAINQLADVYLDTFDWSGGNTSLEAIACHLPIVTCPGEFMRGRHTDSFLKMIDMTETIARDAAEYLQIAIRLGRDPAWRDRLRQQLRERSDRLYDDLDCVRGLEAFYRTAVRDANEELRQSSS